MLRDGPGQLELHNHHVDQSGNRRTTGFDHEVGRLAVQRVTHSVQVAQTGQWVRDLQQRAVHIMAQAAKQFVGIGLEVDHLAPLAQVLPVVGTQDSAASRGQHALRALRQLVQHLFLYIAKLFFAFAFKVLAN